MGAEPADRATARTHLVAVAVALTLTVLMTWPLARDAGDHVFDAIYYWDAYTNAAILGCRVDAVLGLGPLSFYDNYFFAPVENTIVFNENLFGLTLIFAPFYLLSDNPLWAYNVTLMVSLALSVFFTYLLVRRLTGNGYAGIVAGVAFAFCPYATFELARLQLVATQWIPACFLFLHRAVEGRRLADVVGLWLCFVLQVGTCLYYAMFLIPLLALAGGILLWRNRPPRSFYVWLASLGALAGLVVAGMVYPYFTAREAFSLERSLSAASLYDGKLGFFANVHVSNRTLTGMRHLADYRRALEEIAFPGFTVLTMVLLALGVPLWHAVAKRGAKAGYGVAGRWLALLALTCLASLLAHSMLAGAVAFALGLGLEKRRGAELPFAGRRGLYLALLSLSVVLFLGIEPLTWLGEPVRGLYYYLYVNVPGFDGIRKVSRLAVMTTFAFVVLSGFGSAWLFSRLERPRARLLTLALMLVATCLELRIFPHPMRKVYNPDTLPAAYHFMAKLPRDDLVAFVPQNDGVRRFRGDAGMMFHNYLTLYHKHGSPNGESSWIPPVTDLVRRVLEHLPEPGAWRVLSAVGVRHVMIHEDDLPHARRVRFDQELAASELYRRVFHQGNQTIFTLRVSDDPTLRLQEVPALPAGATLIPRRALTAHTDLKPQTARRALDGDPRSFWTPSRMQESGQFFELELDKPRVVVALEIENPWHVMDVPMSFELSVARGSSAWQTVARQPELRVYRQQVHAPKRFVFRVVLPAPTRTDRVRIAIDQPLPGHYLTIHELRLYESAR